jgi:hypothetical protein
MGMFYFGMPLVAGFAFLFASSASPWLSKYEFEFVVGIFLINALYGFLCTVFCSRHYGAGGDRNE